MFFSNFREMETETLNSGPRILNFLILGIALPAAHLNTRISYLNIRSDHEIEATTRGLS